MQSLRIILMAIFASILYGIVHDQITARICVEYFTVGHARLIDSDSPTVLGLFWGIVATWWAGLVFGLGLAMAARIGTRPKLAWSELSKSVGILMAAMFAIALLAGTIGYFTSKMGIFHLVPRIAVLIPPEKHVSFLTAGWAHGASYLAGFAGSVVVWITTWRLRGRLAADASLPPPP